MNDNYRNKILIVDDEKVVLDSCTKTFINEGYDVEVASNGVEGVKKASQNDFDVIITDYQMADIDGIGVIECIKKENPNSPVIMITGHSTSQLEIDATKKGAFEYIQKPFTPEEITSVVKRAIDWHEKVTKEDQKKVFSSLLDKMDIVSKGVGSSAPAAVCNAITKTVGVNKAKMTLLNLIILGFFAGAYIGFGAALATIVSHDASSYVGVGIAKLLSGAVFSVGLMLVVIAGAELFTGNNLMIAATADRLIKTRTLIQKWAIVYFANFIGSLFLVLVMFYSGLWAIGDYAVGAKAVSIASAKVNLSFSEALFRGIGCNWLVCLAVWMASSSHQISGKIVAIFFPITAFVALGFEHCIANMYFIPLGLLIKSTAISSGFGMNLLNLTWINFAVKNLIPVTLGNIIGGAFFVGFLYWLVFLRGKNIGASIITTLKKSA